MDLVVLGVCCMCFFIIIGTYKLTSIRSYKINNMQDIFLSDTAL